MKRLKKQRPTRPATPEVVEEPVGEVAGEVVGLTVFDNIPANAYVRLYRRDPVTKRFNYITRLAPQEATEETVTGLYGGGEYRYQEIRYDESGSPSIARQLVEKYEGPSKPVTAYPASQVPASAAPAPTVAAPAGFSPANAANISFDDVMNMLKLKALASEPAKGTSMPEMLAALTPIATALTSLVTAVVQRREPVDVAALVDKLAVTLHKSESATSPVAMFKDMTDAMNNVLDLKERAGGGGDAGDPLLRMATENLPRLLDIVQASMARKGRKVTADELRKELAPGAAPGSAPAVEAPGWQRFIVSNRKFLLAQATAGKRPDVQAAFAFDMMPDALKGSVRELMAGHVQEDGPNAADQIIGLVPEFGAHRQWLQDFCDVLAGEFFPPETENEIPAGGALPVVEGEGEGEGGEA